ncbi:MAG: hypothetical protein D6785_12870 [Planctomycetota bacterium]|nr:MAG: hypothetical protein D6785_12870 [Planctomycetota bacterium]
MIFHIILFLSGFLLFSIQPMAGKALLPFFGGGAVVWMTALFFFQFSLLIGYAITLYGSKKFSPRSTLFIWLGFFLLTLFILPSYPVHPPKNVPMPFPILLSLLAMVGLPYIFLSTLNPMIQFWQSQNSRFQTNPYILFGSSNLGSLAGLLAYPFFLEIFFPLGKEFGIWKILYGLLCALFLAMAFFLVKGLPKEALSLAPYRNDDLSQEVKKVSKIPLSQKLYWLYLAFLPSLGLMGTTHFLSQDIASFPFLWILPLIVYLLSFIVVFYFPQLQKTFKKIWPVHTAILWITILIYTFNKGVFLRANWIIPALYFSFVFFWICLYFHGTLESEKPHPSRLPTFYFILCLGGALGGAFVTLIAPNIFPSFFEFILFLILALVTIIFPSAKKWNQIIRIIHHSLVLSLFIIISYTELFSYGTSLIHRGRSYYNSYLIYQILERKPPFLQASRVIIQGTTIHGGEYLTKKGEYIPLSYYTQESGIAKVFQKYPKWDRMAVLGLGSGVLALYGKKEKQQIHFFEIDPYVVFLAQKFFHNLEACKASIRITLGDGRIKMEKYSGPPFDRIILDAFTGDAVPSHLLTINAFRAYLSHLSKDGIVLANISNRYIDLKPVIKGLAETLNIGYAFHLYRPNKKKKKFKGIYTSAAWAVLSPNKKLIQELLKEGWDQRSSKSVIWRDDHYYLWPLLKKLDW